MPAELAKRITAAGRVLLEHIPYFAKNFGKVESQWKGADGEKSRVTEADLRLSADILGALLKAFSDDDTVSEEALPAPQDGPRALRSRFCWVLDPIDGTNNYARGLPSCGILLALLEDGRPAYGWTYDHLGRRLIEGGPGRGLLVDGVRQTPAVLPPFDGNSLVSMRLPLPPRFREPLAPLVEYATGRALGSSALHLAYTALGILDGDVSVRGKVWDIAAGLALLAAAGKRAIFIETDPFPLRVIEPKPPELPCISGTEDFLNFTLPLFGKIFRR
jgi:myo-inositol-1(or 4)-monophosphatase